MHVYGLRILMYLVLWMCFAPKYIEWMRNKCKSELEVSDRDGRVETARAQVALRQLSSPQSIYISFDQLPIVTLPQCTHSHLSSKCLHTSSSMYWLIRRKQTYGVRSLPLLMFFYWNVNLTPLTIQWLKSRYCVYLLIETSTWCYKGCKCFTYKGSMNPFPVFLKYWRWIDSEVLV